MKRILCFGDSNTWGLIPGGTQRYPETVRWTGLLQRALGEAYQVIEEGLCGRTTVHSESARPGRSGEQLLPVLLESHAPLDLVILMLGTNDCKTAFHPTARRVALGIRRLLAQIRAGAPGCRVLLISPIRLGQNAPDLDPEFSPESVRVARALPGAYAAEAARWGADYLAASQYAPPSGVDGQHMDAAGHRALALAVEGRVRALLAEQSAS